MAEAAIRTPHEITPQSAPEARGVLLGEVADWLGRTAMLVDTIRQGFKSGNSLQQNTLVAGTGPGDRTLSFMYTTNRVVLPEQSLTPMSERPSVLRKAAVDLILYYDFDGCMKEGDKLPLPTPTPHEVGIQGFAVAANGEAGEYRYRYGDTISVSGHSLDMLRWSPRELGARLPARWSKRQDDSLRNFNAMRELRPDDPQLAEAVVFHRNSLEKYVSLLGSIAAALQMPELNPKK